MIYIKSVEYQIENKELPILIKTFGLFRTILGINVIEFEDFKDYPKECFDFLVYLFKNRLYEPKYETLLKLNKEQSNTLFDIFYDNFGNDWDKIGSNDKYLKYRLLDVFGNLLKSYNIILEKYINLVQQVSEENLIPKKYWNLLTYIGYKKMYIRIPYELESSEIPNLYLFDENLKDFGDHKTYEILQYVQPFCYPFESIASNLIDPYVMLNPNVNSEELKNKVYDFINYKKI